jgi:BRCA1 C Terminus (BRCT) domain
MDIPDGNGNYPLLRMIGQYSDNTYNLYDALEIKEIPNDLSYHEMMARLSHYENSRIRELSLMTKNERELIIRKKLKENDLGWLFHPNFLSSFADWTFKITDDKMVWLIFMIKDIKITKRILNMKKEITLQKLKHPEISWIDTYKLVRESKYEIFELGYEDSDDNDGEDSDDNDGEDSDDNDGEDSDDNDGEDSDDNDGEDSDDNDEENSDVSKNYLSDEYEKSLDDSDKKFLKEILYYEDTSHESIVYNSDEEMDIGYIENEEDKLRTEINKRFKESMISFNISQDDYDLVFETKICWTTLCKICNSRIEHSVNIDYVPKKEEISDIFESVKEDDMCQNCFEGEVKIFIESKGGTNVEVSISKNYKKFKICWTTLCKICHSEIRQSTDIDNVPKIKIADVLEKHFKEDDMCKNCFEGEVKIFIESKGGSTVEVTKGNFKFKKFNARWKFPCKNCGLNIDYSIEFASRGSIEKILKNRRCRNCPNIPNNRWTKYEYEGNGTWTLCSIYVRGQYNSMHNWVSGNKKQQRYYDKEKRRCMCSSCSIYPDNENIDNIQKFALSGFRNVLDQSIHTSEFYFLKKKIEEIGGTVIDYVDNSTCAVICKDRERETIKVKEARKFGIKIMVAEEFLREFKIADH